jgi:hypothetical protein
LTRAKFTALEAENRERHMISPGRSSTEGSRGGDDGDEAEADVSIRTPPVAQTANSFFRARKESEESENAKLLGAEFSARAAPRAMRATLTLIAGATIARLSSAAQVDGIAVSSVPDMSGSVITTSLPRMGV